MSKAAIRSMNPKYKLAIDNLVQTCSSRGWRAAVAILGSREDAEDALQRAFLVAASKASKIPTGDPWPWFAKVVTFECRHLIRQNAGQRKRVRDAMELAEREETKVYTLDDPSDIASQEELAKRALEELAKMEDREREALTLVCMSGLSYAHAAQAMDESKAGVFRLVREGLSLMRKRLGCSESALSLALLNLPIAEPASGAAAAAFKWLAAGSAGAAGAAGISAIASASIGKLVAGIVALATLVTGGVVTVVEWDAITGSGDTGLEGSTQEGSGFDGAGGDRDRRNSTTQLDDKLNINEELNGDKLRINEGSSSTGTSRNKSPSSGDSGSQSITSTTDGGETTLVSGKAPVDRSWRVEVTKAFDFGRGKNWKLKGIEPEFLCGDQGPLFTTGNLLSATMTGSNDLVIVQGTQLSSYKSFGDYETRVQVWSDNKNLKLVAHGTPRFPMPYLAYANRSTDLFVADRSKIRRISRNDLFGLIGLVGRDSDETRFSETSYSELRDFDTYLSSNAIHLSSFGKRGALVWKDKSGKPNYFEAPGKKDGVPLNVERVDAVSIVEDHFAVLVGGRVLYGSTANGNGNSIGVNAFDLANLALSSDGKEIFLLQKNGEIRKHIVPTGENVFVMDLSQRREVSILGPKQSAIAVFRNGDILVGDSSGFLYLARGGRVVASEKVHTHAVSELQIVNNLGFLSVSKEGRSVRHFNASPLNDTIQSSSANSWHNYPIQDLVWTHRGRNLLSVDAEGELRTWEGRKDGSMIGDTILLPRNRSNGKSYGWTSAFSREGESIAYWKGLYTLEIATILNGGKTKVTPIASVTLDENIYRGHAPYDRLHFNRALSTISIYEGLSMPSHFWNYATNDIHTIKGHGTIGSPKYGLWSCQNGESFCYTNDDTNEDHRVFELKVGAKATTEAKIILPLAKNQIARGVSDDTSLVLVQEELEDSEQLQYSVIDTLQKKRIAIVRFEKHLFWSPTTVAFYDNDTKLLLGTESGDILVWDLKKNVIKERLFGHTGRVTHLRISPDGKRLASAATDRRIYVWKLP